MAADMKPGQGGFSEAKGTDIWTDVIIVGGSVPHDTGGNVQYIYGSGTNQIAKFGIVTYATGSITTSVRAAQLTVVGSVTAQGYGVPSVYTGSPISAVNPLIQVGLSGTGAGSTGWVGFHEKWAAAPKVIASVDSGSGAVSTGSIGTGSFLLFTETASTLVNWIALGTKA